MFGVTEPRLADLQGSRVAVLPDLFADVLVPLPAWEDARGEIDAVARRGGGNLPVDGIELTLGGNAANLAVALARLGARVDLLAETDDVGRMLLERAAGDAEVGTEGLRVGSRRSTTASLECDDANVMLSDPGPLVDFGPDRLRERDWRLLEAADAVALVNWAQNERGTDLLEAIAERVGDLDAFVYLDTGDPRHRLADPTELAQAPSVWDGVDAWGLNENELYAFASDGAGDPLDAARDLSARLDVRLDLHTRRWAATTRGHEPVRVEAPATPARRLTGAGDAFNAGNLAGYLLDLPDRERLALAHRVAEAYVTSPRGRAPTLSEVQAPR